MRQVFGIGGESHTYFIFGVGLFLYKYVESFYS